MPPKLRQRRHAQNKRLQVTDPLGWTHVVKGCKSIVQSDDLTKHVKALRIHDDVTLDEVAKKYQKYAQVWRQSECCQKILRILEQDVLSQNHLTFTQCVCLGLGSPSSGRGSSTYELAALVSMLETLRTKHIIKDVLLQDPAFSSVDTDFLTSLGYKVVSTPSAFDMITPMTFLFAPHLENTFYAFALKEAHPALCIGNEIEPCIDGPVLFHNVEDETWQRETFERFIDTTTSKALPHFDHDTWCVSTRIYWLKAEETDFRERTSIAL